MTGNGKVMPGFLRQRLGVTMIAAAIGGIVAYYGARSSPPSPGFLTLFDPLDRLFRVLFGLFLGGAVGLALEILLSLAFVWTTWRSRPSRARRAAGFQAPGTGTGPAPPPDGDLKEKGPASEI